MRESVSAPMTRARFDSPQRTYLSAIESAYMKPAQAVSTLKAGTPRQPSRCCSSTPQLGNTRSGVVVPKAMKSTSPGARPGGLERAARGVLGQVDGGLAVGGHVAALDAGAAADPLVGRVDDLLEVEVGDDLLRQVRAGAGDARIDQLAAPCACNACAMCAVSPRRAASAAVPIARAKATRSARPWLFTTIPVSPTMQAPL